MMMMKKSGLYIDLRFAPARRRLKLRLPRRLLLEQRHGFHGAGRAMVRICPACKQRLVGSSSVRLMVKTDR